MRSRTRCWLAGKLILLPHDVPAPTVMDHPACPGHALQAGRSSVPGAGLAVLAYHLGRGVAARHLLARVASEDPSGDLAPGGSASAGFRVLVSAEHGADPHQEAGRYHDHDDDDAQGGCCHRYPPPPSTTQPARVMRPGANRA